MQIRLQRSEREGGLFGRKKIYAIDIRAEYTPDEKDYINSHNLGKETLFMSTLPSEGMSGEALNRGSLLSGIRAITLEKLSLLVTVASLARGHHIESADLPELAQAEASILDGCKALKALLQAGNTFDGREAVIDI